MNRNTIVGGGDLKVGYALANIHNGSPYAVTNNYMASGSLTTGGTNAKDGTATSWSASTAGLLMECSDYTEISTTPDHPPTLILRLFASSFHYSESGLTALANRTLRGPSPGRRGQGPRPPVFLPP